MFGATTVLFLTSLLAGDVPAENAFKEWGDYFVGGVWSTTNSQGKHEEVRYEWILNKAFVRLTVHGAEETTQEINGIDPAAGRWTFWGFDSKGRVYKGVAEQPKPGVWTYVSSGHGKAGPMSSRSKDVKLSDDQERFEVLEAIKDGKKQPAEVQIWTRSREARPRAGGAARPDAAGTDMTAAEKAFRERGDWQVGGTWTGTSPEYKVETRWEWVLDKSFLQLNGKDNYGAWLELHGIDPMSGKVFSWGVDEKGRVWLGTVESPRAGEWVYRIAGRGKAGVMIWNSKETKLDEDRTQLELQEIVVDGKKEPSTSLILTRKK